MKSRGGVERNKVGKSAKYLYRWLEEDEYQTYLDTYFGKKTEDAWNAILTMCGLFDSVTQYAAQKLGYTCDIEEGRAAAAFLRHVKNLPKDAKEIY